MGLEVRRASSVREAVELLAHEPKARLLAGGTMVVRNVNSGDPSIGVLVLADGLGLSGVEIAGGRARIGAVATMAQVAELEALAFLRPVALSIGGPAVRAMATVGGNLFAPYPYGDFATALQALNAEVTVEGTRGPRTVSLEEFLGKREHEAVIVSETAFNIPPQDAFRFIKAVRKRPHGASVLSIAAVLPVADGKLADPRFAYGAMGPHAMRARAVERALDGRPLDRDAIRAAVAVAGEGCSALTDAFATSWYRLKVLPVYLRRLLEGG